MTTHPKLSVPYQEAQEAIAFAAHLDDPRNPPNVSGQLAVAKALLAVAFELACHRDES